MSDNSNNKYEFITDEYWQTFIRTNKNKSLENILFSLDKNTPIDKGILADQFIGRKIIRKKIPSWLNQPGVIFPPKINLEQSSSELTARYKSSLFVGDSFIDITGGLGVDAYFMGQSFEQAIHCEVNRDLHFITKYNYTLFNSNVKTILSDGVQYLKESHQKFDLIYLDPSRRNEQNNKLVQVEDYQPDVLSIIDTLFSKTENILLKTSPLLDIKQAIRLIPNIKQLHIISIDNECKELLFILNKSYQTRISIKCIDLSQDVSFNFKLEDENQVCKFSLPMNYLYEPNVSILKAGAFNSVGNKLNIKKIHPNSHLYTSKNRLNFPGRSFKIIKVVKFDKKKIIPFLENNKANITKRNFPLTVSQIRKKTGFKEGGDVYLFATTLMNNKLRIIICQKV
ncbi:MAG: THUMP-like domain-containing protein [Flavobacteriales bacterium]